MTDFHSILTGWRNHSQQLFDLHEVSDVRQTEIYTAETIVPEPSAFKFEMATENLKRDKSQDNDQIPTELIKAGVRKIRSEIQKLINSIWNTEELPEEWKESIIIPIYKKGDERSYSNYTGISILSTTYKIVSNILP